jgi:hypothetical protein
MLRATYEGYGVTFSETIPVGQQPNEIVEFGYPTPEAVYGRTQYLDGGNRLDNENSSLLYSADVDSRKLWKGVYLAYENESWSTQLSHFAYALANVAAHELGHTLGLRRPATKSHFKFKA